jgi:hypothetical protein
MRFRAPVLAVTVLILTASMLLGPSNARAYSSGAPDGVAGEPPGFNTCAVCHGFAAGDGAIAILGLPPAYQPGTTYDLQVELQDPGQSRWGFELTVVDDATGEAAGSLVVVDGTHTQLSDNAGTQLDYLKQTSAGTYNGTPDGPVTWDFQWLTPASGADVTLYVAGNGANGNSGPGGDFVYSTSAGVGAASTGIGGAWTPVAAGFLRPAYPNPAFLSTSIPYELATTTHVRIRVHDVAGRVVSELFDGVRPAGTYRATWDGIGRSGVAVANGVYFVALSTDDGRQARQRIVIAR